MKNLILICFIAMLAISATLGIFPVYAILITIVLYFALAVQRGANWRSLLKEMGTSMKTSAGVFLVFTFIGVMGALWRSSGLMAFLVVQGLSFLNPRLFLLFSFLLCSSFSFLIGSSLATASIIGVLLVTIGGVLGISPALIGGAVLSGSFVGDRASFLSSSAYLTATITKIDYKTHVRNLLSETPIPLLLTALLYGGISLILGFQDTGSQELFPLGDYFNLSYPLIFLPLIIVLLPMVTKLKLVHSVILSSITAFILSILYQGLDFSQVFRYAILGFHSNEKALQILNGGGLISMLKPMIMVAVSSLLPPLLSSLDVLSSLNRIFGWIAEKGGPFMASVASGLFTSLIACSQTLAMLMQLPILDSIYTSDQQEAKALSIGNTSVVYSSMIPWNIAMANAVLMMNAPFSSGWFAFYPWIQTLFILIFAGKRYQPSS